jgi:uncharacterized protein
MMHLKFPFAFDSAGKTATTDWDDHALDLLIQFMCTHPKERVNRPDFGTPLPRVCFEGNSQGLAELIQFVTRAGLDRWLGEVLEIVDLSVQAEEATLLVDLKYRVRGEPNVREEKRRIPLADGGLPL